MSPRSNPARGPDFVNPNHTWIDVTHLRCWTKLAQLRFAITPVSDSGLGFLGAFVAPPNFPRHGVALPMQSLAQAALVTPLLLSLARALGQRPGTLLIGPLPLFSLPEFLLDFGQLNTSNRVSTSCFSSARLHSSRPFRSPIPLGVMTLSSARPSGAPRLPAKEGEVCFSLSMTLETS